MLKLIVTVFILQEIDRKEARINAMRCAILETFPEPNRRLLQRWSLALSFSLSLFPLNWQLYSLLTLTPTYSFLHSLYVILVLVCNGMVNVE